MKEDIVKIIQDGIMAPSGENCQPWRFVVDNDQIYTYNIPEADTSLYNHGQKGSFVAHGALIENMYISSLRHGYDADIKIFPHENDPDLVSIITLRKTVPIDEPLYNYIERRHTNRKQHSNKKLTQDQKNFLLSTAVRMGLGDLHITDEPVSMKVLGEAMAVNEQIVFENKHVHQFFYDHLLWKSEDQNKAGGFYYKTLEFLPHQLRGVKMLKYRPVLKVLNKLAKISKKIAKENAEKYSDSAAIAIITVNGHSNKDYVDAGRLMERVWLEATKLGLSVHPCTGVLFFMESIKGGNDWAFSQEHKQMISNAYDSIETIFKVKGKAIPMMFRLGYSDEATARAKRLKPNLVFKS
jgi:hypothetical protein